MAAPSSLLSRLPPGAAGAQFLPHEKDCLRLGERSENFRAPARAIRRPYVFGGTVGMARRAVPARVAAGGTNIHATLAFERAVPLHAAPISQRAAPTCRIAVVHLALSDGEREPASCDLLKSSVAAAGT